MPRQLESGAGRRTYGGGSRYLGIWLGRQRTDSGRRLTPKWRAQCQALADRHWAVWQRPEATECERQGRWFAAIWHLNRLRDQNPDDADLRKRRDAAREHLPE